MKEHSRKLLDKAVDSIEAAELIVDMGKSEMAVGRAYYAEFYIAEALLNERGLKFNKHSAVHAAFGEHFTKTKEMNPKFHRWLLDSFDKKQVGDYDVETEIESAVTVNVIHQAREFLEAAREYLEKPQT